MLEFVMILLTLLLLAAVAVPIYFVVRHMQAEEAKREQVEASRRKYR